LFGATRLPQLGASLGSAIKNFKRGFSSEDEGHSDEKKDQASLASASTTAPGKDGAGTKAGASREG
jgi:sec-independent protein translocase protein TatA